MGRGRRRKYRERESSSDDDDEPPRKRKSTLGTVLKVGAAVTGLVATGLILNEIFATGKRKYTTEDEDLKLAMAAVRKRNPTYLENLDILFSYTDQPDSEIQRKNAIVRLVDEFGAPNSSVSKWIGVLVNVVSGAIPTATSSGIYPEVKARFEKVKGTDLTAVVILFIQLLNEGRVTAEQLLNILDLVHFGLRKPEQKRYVDYARTAIRNLKFGKGNGE